jgi:hypothetical protein
MSQADLRELLGAPEFDCAELGLVEGPDDYIAYSSSNDEKLRQQGFRDYRRQHWTSSQISIVVVSDKQGQVVCRYTSHGEPWNWRVLLRYLINW